MMMKQSLIFVFLCSALIIGDCQVNYDGHQVLRTYPADRSQTLKLFDVRANYDFWTEPRIGGPTDIRIGGQEKVAFQKFLNENGIRYEIMVEDVQRLINLEKIWQAKALDGTRMDWTSYHSVADIQSWTEEMASIYPNVSQILEIGTSYEGRPLKLIKIGRNSGFNKPALFMDAGIHAREWIAPAVATYIINQLLTNQNENGDILDAVDIYIIPTFNVDGYEYTRASNGDRMWRKSRQDHSNGTGCIGADLNRNFDEHFGGSGTSTNKCSEVYMGPRPYSEPETKAMSDFILNTNADWRVYVALHSYSQMFLHPWGWDWGELPDDVEDLRKLGNEANAALKAVHGSEYEVGSITELLSPGAGASDDWAKSSVFKYSYTIELRDTGRYGFVLPPDQIIPTSQEAWAAVQVFARSLL